MAQYPSYKDSGFDWIGQIPSHWGLLKSKFLWRESFNTSATGTEDLLSVSQYDGVTPANGSRSESLVGYKVVEENSLVINIMLAWMGGLGVSAYNGLVSPAYCVYKMQGDNNPKYMHYLYKTPTYLAEFARHSTGVIPSRWRMYTDDFGQVLTLIPPRKEQDAMVAYLDAATAKIDEAIAQQRQMIELLNERRQIIICRIITKGLDAKAKMKDSGIEWVGDVPDSWEKRRIYYTIDRRFDGAWGDDEKGNSDDVICYRIADFDYQKGYLDDKKFTLRNVEPETRKKKQVQKGDLLVEKSGGGDLYPVGRVVSVNYEQDAICSNFIQALKIKDGFDSRFIFYVFKALYSKKVNIPFFNQTTGIQNLQVKEYLKNEMFYPSYEEQCKISGFLDSISNSIQDGIEDCNRMITLLQERKQIIINDVVTGKVKVV